MNHPLRDFVFVALALITSACRPATVSREPRPTPTATPPTQSVDFIEAVSAGTVDYQLKSTSVDRKVSLYVTDKSPSPIRLNVAPGTLFESVDIDLQFVVYKTANFVTERKVFQVIELDIASLDIHKIPPINMGTAWRVHKSPRLTQFLQCSSDALEKKRKSNDSYAKLISENDIFMVPYSIWSARGATRDDFTDYLVHYVRSKYPETTIRAYGPIWEEVVRTCGELKKID
jgi:hypothetical protein